MFERIARSIAQIRSALTEWNRVAGKARVRDKATKRYYVEGDVAPDSLINRPPGSGPIGAMVAIDPETKRITKIFFP